MEFAKVLKINGTRKDGYLKMENIIQNDSSIFLLEAYIDALKDIQSEYPENLIINFVQ